MERNVRQIGDTPLSILVYSVESSPTHMNEPGIVEIIFCLKGSVRFSYSYEEFTLRAGDYIAVDRDAYFLYKGKDNICVSFYIDLNRYKDKYPFVDHALFVCEGTPETDVKNYPTRAHVQMKGLLIAALKKILDSRTADGLQEISDPQAVSDIQAISDQIADLLVNRFDIIFYHYGGYDISQQNLERNLYIREYMYRNLDKEIKLSDISKELGITDSYMSELMRRTSVGFRGMLGYMRANKSEWYLMNTDMTIMEISEECGFSDVKYYYSAFKKWYKCTPRQFRERYCQITVDEVEYMDIKSAEKLINDIMQEYFMSLFI